MPYRPAFFAALGTEIVRKLRAAEAPPLKVLAHGLRRDAVERGRRRGWAVGRRRRCASAGIAGVRARAAGRGHAAMPLQQERGGRRAGRARASPRHAAATRALRGVADQLGRQVREPAIAGTRTQRRRRQLRVSRRQPARMRGGPRALSRGDRPDPPERHGHDPRLPRERLGLRSARTHTGGLAARQVLRTGCCTRGAAQRVADVRRLHLEPAPRGPVIRAGSPSICRASPSSLSAPTSSTTRPSDAPSKR